MTLRTQMVEIGSKGSKRNMVGQPRDEVRVEADFYHARWKAFCSWWRSLPGSTLESMFSVKSA